MSVYAIALQAKNINGYSCYFLEIQILHENAAKQYARSGDLILVSRKILNFVLGLVSLSEVDAFTWKISTHAQRWKSGTGQACFGLGSGPK